MQDGKKSFILPKINNKSKIRTDLDEYKNVVDYEEKLSYNEDNKSKDKSENIKVCLRVRPLNKKEKEMNKYECVSVVDKCELKFVNFNQKTSKHFVFDYVFGQESSQDDVFYICGLPNLIDSIFEGYSATVFAYGQTGSGKTHTILGKDECINLNDIISSDFAGLIPKSIKTIWNKIITKSKNSDSLFYVKASFCEIYNEVINDLLAPHNKNLNIRLNVNQGFFIQGISILDCTTMEDLVEVILEGVKNRKTGSHNLNPDSSRSHSILTIYITSEDRKDGLKKYGKLTFVDLAGSERLKDSQSTGIMVKETGSINKSLFVLGKVINSLSDPQLINQYISYRDSKLTMLLSDSIGGSSKTLMIACISPSMEWSEETFSTLQYASKTKNIKNKPVLKIQDNEKEYFDAKRANELLKKENEILKSELIKLTGSYSDDQNEIDNEFFFPELIKELNDLKSAKEKYLKDNELKQKHVSKLELENEDLSNKLNNLEVVLIGPNKLEELNKAKFSKSSEMNIKDLTKENYSLKENLSKLEIQKSELLNEVDKFENPGIIMIQNNNNLELLNEQNRKLTKRVEYLQKRERELLQTMLLLKNQK
jgi:kinesin family protein 12